MRVGPQKGDIKYEFIYYRLKNRKQQQGLGNMWKKMAVFYIFSVKSTVTVLNCQAI